MPDELKAFRKIIYNLIGFVSVTLAYIIAYMFRFGTFNVFKEKYYLMTYGLIVLFWVIIAIEVSKELNSYKLTAKNILINTLKRAIAIFIYVSCIDFVAKLSLSRIFTAVFIIVYIFIGIIFKLPLLKLEEIISKSFKEIYIILIGTNEDIEYLKNNNLQNYNINDYKIKTIEINPENGNTLEDVVQRLCNFMKNSIVDEVIVLANDLINTRYTKKFIDICKTGGRKLRIIYKNEFGMGNPKLSIDDKNIIFEYEPIKTGIVYKFLKRLLDIVLSLIALVITSPLFLLIAILIKLDSPDGPVFFIQERVGLNGRRFNLIKFRTMIPDADKLKQKLMKLNEMDGPVFKITNDPRVTRVGKILRKLSLDELPQLINVLKGEMSLVGPRPLETEEALGCDFEYHIRHSVKPGLTCIWQTTHNRNDVGYSEWMKMDYEYIVKRSFLLDVYLIFKTLLTILRLNGK